MKIKTLSLYDFRGIHELTLNPEGKSMVLFGINGSGKSTILSAINLLYANIINRIVNNRFKQQANIELTDIQKGKGVTHISGVFQFEDGYIGSYGRTMDVQKNRRLGDNDTITALTEHFRHVYLTMPYIDSDNNLIETPDTKNMPVFVNYGVNRLVLQTPLRLPNRQFDKLSAFEKAIENKIDFKTLFEWFRDQEDYENQIRVNKDRSYKDKSLAVVKKAMLAMLDGVHNIHIERRPYSMVLTKNGELLEVTQLSDGEKCTLALFGDLARRLALANPSLDNPLEGTGVILIDEVELHMHTSWQRKVLTVLKKTFPNIQFIITTHSPQVLGEVTDDFLLFTLQAGKHSVTCKPLLSLYGLDSNVILEELMGTPSMNENIRHDIQQVFNYIAEQEFQQAEELADRIDLCTHQTNADISRARILINKGKTRYHEKNK